MTTPQDIQAALDALDLLQKRAYSHAEKSNGPKEMRDWIDSDAEKIRAAIQSHAPAHDAGDLEALKQEAFKAVPKPCQPFDEWERIHHIAKTIDHLAPRLARMDDPFNLPDGYDVYVIGRNHEDGYWIEVRDTKNNILARDMGMRILHENTMAELFSAAREMILESEWYNDGQYSVKAPQQKKGE